MNAIKPEQCNRDIRTYGDVIRHMTNDELALFLEWRRDRDAAVDKLDTEAYRKFYAKWTELGMYDCPLPDNEITLMASICKMALSIERINGTRKEEAREWLRVHGMKAEGICA